MKNRYKFSTLLMALVIFAVGCGSTESTNQASVAKPTDGGSANVKKIIVGTGTKFPNVCFIDENGKLTGYDVELVRELDQRLPGYEFEFQTMEFANLLLSLETKKIDFIAHEMEKNPEREQKYLFNKEPYVVWKTKLIVTKVNNTIQSLDDLKGKKAYTTATSAAAQILENYNKANNNAINIVYSNGSANDAVNQLTAGRADATLGSDFSRPLIDPQGKLKTVGEPLVSSNVLFMFRKDEPEAQALADQIDEAIKQLKADGTLTKLSNQWLGGDYTK
ncbi:L-cystine-binding protein TcyK [Brevibacillus reuszeri]|uniref:L-cystine-binding protein TcyJ n=1 Tax=Brevibacillus reuszeri TaxID=54915 RepID=A0A0K9YW51_9BACL|nr:transporter substrate-binding domain-containing protein [Brevibacillus reuszeri]KNB72901.1 L-cystine-binding protein TcyJ [Brevibacillus reuszeri]MED1861735.1 transporter substrate-binding domain-containing protein [Brevibacillus reuszeri]GED72747.1 L-cystine-binding protein TcyK [Brevibacillus reuszeri]